MDYKESMEKFYERFGIQNNATEDEEKEKFRIGIKNVLDGIDSKINENEIKRFCSWFGFETKWEYTKNRVNNFKYGHNLINCIFNEENWVRYLHKIEALFLLPMSNELYPYHKNDLFTKVKEIFDNSYLSIGFLNSKGKYLVYPTGTKFLDDELVIKTLKFLNIESHNHFIQALKSYSEKNPSAYIKAAESMRRALEEYLRHIFDNTKGLQGNIAEIGAKLKNLNKQKQLKDIINNYFHYLDNFFNENSKHNDGDINEAECELIILQTGLLMKYLDKIRDELV